MAGLGLLGWGRPGTRGCVGMSVALRTRGSGICSASAHVPLVALLDNQPAFGGLVRGVEVSPLGFHLPLTSRSRVRFMPA